MVTCARFETLFRFGGLLNDDMQIELVERDGAATLRCDGPVGHSLRYERIAAEMVTLGIFMLIRQFSPDARLESASFAYAAPDYHREYTRVFRSAERFAQPFTGLVFDAALLDARSPYKDEILLLNLRTVAEQRIARLRRAAPYWQQVSDYLRLQPAPHRITMAEVAKALCVSERSLQRRLTDAGNLILRSRTRQPRPRPRACWSNTCSPSSRQPTKWASLSPHHSIAHSSAGRGRRPARSARGRAEVIRRHLGRRRDREAHEERGPLPGLGLEA